MHPSYRLQRLTSHVNLLCLGNNTHSAARSFRQRSLALIGGIRTMASGISHKRQVPTFQHYHLEYHLGAQSAVRHQMTGLILGKAIGRRCLPVQQAVQRRITSVSSSIIPSPSPGSSSGRSGLSDGAKAGIGVRIAVAALIAVGATNFLIRKRRTNPMQSGASSQQAALFNHGAIELRHQEWGQDMLTGQGHKPEEDQQPETYEVPGSGPAGLLIDDHVHWELAA